MKTSVAAAHSAGNYVLANAAGCVSAVNTTFIGIGSTPTASNLTPNYHYRFVSNAPCQFSLDKQGENTSVSGAYLPAGTIEVVFTTPERYRLSVCLANAGLDADAAASGIFVATKLVSGDI